MRAAPVARKKTGEPWQQYARLLEKRMRRIDDEETGARERRLAVWASGARSNVKLKPKNVRSAGRGDCIEEAGVGHGVTDRAPRQIKSGRPFCDRPLECGPHALKLVRRFERRIDEDETATLPWRNIGVEGDISVRAD